MELTQEQVEAAQACGCTFLPASEAQVARLSMQRRVFTLGRKPFVATRDGGGFPETHASLTRLIEAHGRGGPSGTADSVAEAAAADAAAAHEIAGERGAGGGAQEVRRRRAATRPRAPWRGAKRDG